jgi:4-hydroxyphenylpyruvate dioxygenase-like putative hemolysin
LERQGARGFGAGNITALAQSIILYQKQQHELLV